MNKDKRAQYYPLGRFIEEVSMKLGTETRAQISGINLSQGFIPTVANMTGVDTSKYKLVPLNTFACNLMHIGRDVALPLAYNRSEGVKAVSPAYYIFRVQEKYKDIILDEYLELILTRPEFGRLAWFKTDASIRGNLPEKTFLEISIPLPSLKIQKEIIHIYTGLKRIAEQNEMLIKPLSELCEAYIMDCRKSYKSERIGNYIYQDEKKNNDLSFGQNELRGVTNEGTFAFSKANTIGLKFNNYKIVEEGSFAYNPARINIGSIALNRNQTCIISPMYCVFRIREEKKQELIPEFLDMWFRRKEFQRSTLFYATGSVRDIFDFSLMCETQIPIVPLPKQKAVIKIYHCMENAKMIAAKARNVIKDICPALLQKACNS